VLLLPTRAWRPRTAGPSREGRKIFLVDRDNMGGFSPLGTRSCKRFRRRRHDGVPDLGRLGMPGIGTQTCTFGLARTPSRHFHSRMDRSPDAHLAVAEVSGYPGRRRRSGERQRQRMSGRSRAARTTHRDRHIDGARCAECREATVFEQPESEPGRPRDGREVHRADGYQRQVYVGAAYQVSVFGGLSGSRRRSRRPRRRCSVREARR